MCKICTPPRFHIWALARAEAQAQECNQFANFRYFAAFANARVFGSLAVFLTFIHILEHIHFLFPFRLYYFPHRIAIYFVLFLHLAACLARIERWAWACLSVFDDARGKISMKLGKYCLFLSKIKQFPQFKHTLRYKRQTSVETSDVKFEFEDWKFDCSLTP